MIRKSGFQICGALRDLVPFVQFTLLHGCFSRFFNCTNGTKSRNASYLAEVSD